MMKQTEEEASKYACQILRVHFIGLDHPNINAYDDPYVINNYPFEWSLFMDGWKFACEIFQKQAVVMLVDAVMTAKGDEWIPQKDKDFMSFVAGYGLTEEFKKVYGKDSNRKI